MLEIGVIEESNSTCCSPIDLVAKTDGNIQFCVDYRMVSDGCTSSWIAHFFMTLDLTKGYWLIPL